MLYRTLVASQTHFDLSGNIANMVNMKYFEIMCLGGYRDSSIAYQFQSRKLLQFKVLLKFILPVILLSFYAASSSNECVFLSLNIALQRNQVQIMKVKFPCRRVTMLCTYNNVLFTQSILILQSCLSTWLSNNVSTDEILFPNYQRPFRKDRTNNSYGGVIIYVKETIPCKRRSDLEIDGVECIWLEIKLKAKLSY